MNTITRDARERLAREHIEKARSLKNETTEQMEEVMRHLTLSITYNPLFVNALLLRAHQAVRLTRYDVAVADLSIVIQLEENGFDRRRLAGAYGTRGNVYRKMNKVADSIVDLSRAVEVEPDNGTWLYELGLAYSMQGSRALAQHFFASALVDKVAGRMTDIVRFRALSCLGTCKLNAGDINGAVTVLNKGLEIQETASLHNLLGITYFTREEYKVALQHFQRSLELDCLCSEYHINLGACLFQLGLMSEALKQFEDAVLKGTRQALHHFFRGNTALVLGMHPQALIDVDEAIALDPAREAHHYAKALAFIAEGRHDEAQAELNTTVELNPAFHKAWVHAGLLNFLKGELFAALNCFAQALELKEADHLVHESIGLVYYSLTYYDLAVASFTRCIALRPEEASFYFRRGAARLVQGDIHGAYLDLHEAVHERKFREPQVLHCLSVTLGQLGRDAEALEFSNEAVLLNPKNCRYLLQRAECYYAVGNYAQAVEDASTIVLLGSKCAEVYYLRARSYYALRRFKEAPEDLLQAASLQPLLRDSADYCYALGVAYLHAGTNQHEAEAVFTKAIQLHPKPPACFFDDRATVREQLGDTLGELSDLDAVLKNDPNDPNALLRRSLAHKALHRYEAAARDFEKAKSLDVVGDVLAGVPYEKLFDIDHVAWGVEE
ncbi:TPR Domain containing protein [Trypanosoma grayi]|uniref:TPR Domain containing protein n=1 Tax=Trypanosoma grayi TaxID=71804 RepID=UPI0004F41B4E|nr:TPR Domain containing protein [Trypanosoma grayi]KEG12274.1 TPR Domain containing protein [Trypanosoma grayi]